MTVFRPGDNELILVTERDVLTTSEDDSDASMDEDTIQQLMAESKLVKQRMQPFFPQKTQVASLFLTYLKNIIKKGTNQSYFACRNNLKNNSKKKRSKSAKSKIKSKKVEIFFYLLLYSKIIEHSISRKDFFNMPTSASTAKANNKGPKSKIKTSSCESEKIDLARENTKSVKKTHEHAAPALNSSTDAGLVRNRDKNWNTKTRQQQKTTEFQKFHHKIANILFNSLNNAPKLLQNKRLQFRNRADYHRNKRISLPHLNKARLSQMLPPQPEPKKGLEIQSLEFSASRNVFLSSNHKTLRKMRHNKSPTL
ncbi:hypothetical protein RFI_12286 [Reticulomyxa filosa]|uniref:RdRp catalytic domain-containing protein n=1 Tax=Reticulomyxa filosa TaxID=46433 RepID=X6NEZ6_RETFI|nr:hypothetical protein RFI_12286 [Reticulomyxa filosa]|eukprot:ETO24870.1 hypothetical protein RFI_12286 [Reticulomyxa filosa]